MKHVEPIYRRLLVWRQGREFVLAIYRLTGLFPKHELYGMVSQLRRAAVSSVTNIVEGHEKTSRREFLRF